MTGRDETSGSAVESSSYLAHFNLLQPPFDEVRNPAFFYESQDHLEALERLEYIIEDGNMNIGLLTGEIGSGKTMTRTVLQRRVDPERFELVALENSFFPFIDVLYEIVTRLRQSGVTGAAMASGATLERGDKYGLFQYFREAVEHLHRSQGRRFVLVLDEAQSMEPKELDELKNLTNVSHEDCNLVTLILVGQPELREHVRSLKQVDQRVSLRFHLNNLDLPNLRRYIQHRLRVAGHPDGNLFSSRSEELLFRHTLGIPREINRACKLALEYAFANGLDQVGEDAVKVVLEDLQRHRV